MSSMTIKQRLLVTNVLVILAFAILALAAVGLLGKNRAVLDDLYQERFLTVQSLHDLRDDFLVRVTESVNKANAGLLSAEATRMELREARNEGQKLWKSYAAGGLGAEEQRAADKVSDALAAAERATKAAEARLQSLQGNVAGQLGDIDGALYAPLDKLAVELADLLALEQRLAKAEYEATVAMDTAASAWFTIGSAIAAILVALLGVVTRNAVVTPLSAMQKTMSEVARDSDITLRLDDRSRDEFGDTARGFNRMMDRIHTLVGEVLSSAVQLAAASEELSAASLQGKSATADQAREMEHVAAAITQMTSTVSNVADNAAQAHQKTEQANSLAAKGRDVVMNSRDNVIHLVQDIEVISREMERLKNSTTGINSIVDVINNIAAQTNLLALNAAIEAARAGEQGRGFAVVADEVRALAQRTQNSTQEIRTAIEQLQSGAMRAVQAVESGSEKAELSADNSQMAAQALQQIAAAIEDVASMNTQIASAAEQQATVSNQLGANVVSINDLARQTAVGAEQTAVASSQVAELASHLQKMVATFKV